MTQDPDKPKTQRTMGLIIMTVVLDFLGLGLIIPIFALLLLEDQTLLGPEVGDEVRNITYGMLIATFSICQFLSAPLLGTASDRYGRKPILFISLMGTIVGYLLIALGIYLQDLVWVFIGRGVQGMAAGNLSIVYSAISDISQPEEKPKNFGLVGVAFGIGFIIGPVVGGVLSDPTISPYFSFMTPFLAAAFLVLVNLILVYLRFPETLAQPDASAKISARSAGENLWKAARHKELGPMFLVVFFFTFGFTFFTQFIQPYMIKVFSFDSSDLGFILGYIGVIVALTQGLLVRVLSRRAAPASILRVSLAALSVSFLIILIPTKVWELYLFLPLMAIWQGIANPNISALISNLAPPQQQGQVLGMQQSVSSFAQIWPPLIGGVVTTWSISSPMWLAAIMVGFAWLAFVIQFGLTKGARKVN